MYKSIRVHAKVKYFTLIVSSSSEKPLFLSTPLPSAAKVLKSNQTSTERKGFWAQIISMSTIGQNAKFPYTLRPRETFYNISESEL